MFKLTSYKKIKYFEITELKNFGVKAIFTSKIGGISSNNYAELNLGLHTSDKSKNVIENRRLISEAIDIDYHDLIAAEQIHGNKIYRVLASDKGRGALNLDTVIEGIDGLITDVKDLPLISFYADCVPIYLYDPVYKAVGLAHSGWKGTVLKIVTRMLERMEDEFGTRPADCLVAIGPSISANNYEVDDRVFNSFKKTNLPLHKFFRKNNDGKYQLDLWKANEIILRNKGIPSEQIIQSKLCTYSHSDLFYSYRRDGKNTGRMASIIVL